MKQVVAPAQPNKSALMLGSSPSDPHLCDEELDEVEDLRLAAREDVLRDVDVERLRVRRQVVVARDLLRHRRHHGLRAHQRDLPQRQPRRPAAVTRGRQRQTVLVARNPPVTRES